MIYIGIDLVKDEEKVLENLQKKERAHQLIFNGMTSKQYRKGLRYGRLNAIILECCLGKIIKST